MIDASQCYAGGAPAVITRGLTKRYGDEIALSGIDLLVPDGAVYVLVGANGAGKSTTMKLLLNLERADAGSALLFGLNTGTSGPEVRAQTGYVPEHHDVGYRGMTCDRLLRHAAVYYPAWDQRYANRLVAAFELPLNRRAGKLSKGEARRLQLVLAMAHRPPLLLLDEPTDGLDPAARSRTLSLLAAHLAETPTTVLISTHRVYEVETLADHVGVLRAGRLIAQMSCDDLRRAVRRYRVASPDGWELPGGMQPLGHGASDGRRARELQLTLMGDEQEVTARLVHSGAEVREVTSLRLEDAVLACLTEDARP